MTTPLRQPRRLSRDTISSASRRRESSQSGIPTMTASRSAANRQATTQPTYDFLGGGGGNAGSSPPGKQISRTAIRHRQGSVPRADIGNEDLRAQVKTLQYEVESYKQEKEMTKLRHEKELRDAQLKAEADFKRAQNSESSKNATAYKQEALAQELKDLQDRATNTQHDLEKKLRAAQDRNRSLQEEVEEAQSELASSSREHSHRLQGVERQLTALQQTLSEVRGELESKAGALQVAQARLASREDEVGTLESELLKLKAQGGDTEELAAAKRELTEQVSQMRRLEKTNREQLAELRGLRQSHRAVGIVEEEKRVLELKVQRMEDLERELGEAKFQRQVLEDERRAWTAYLRQGEGEAATEFDSPEAVARALAEERLERASLAERLGALQPELAEKEALLQTLEAERNRYRTELETAKASAGSTAPAAATSSSSSSSSSDARAKARAERQKALAIKEVEYLREQLRVFEAEDVTANSDLAASATAVDEQARKRISELEELVAKYRAELDTANTTVSALESAGAGNATSTSSQAPSLKRKSPSSTSAGDHRAAGNEEEAEARLGALSRKTRTLQTELQTAHNQTTLLQTENSTLKSQLESLRQAARTRVLSLRSNPTDDYHALKGATIATLREENAALRERILGPSVLSSQSQSQSRSTRSSKDKDKDAAAVVVPASSLQAARHEIAELEQEVRERDKRISRLKQIWSRKALELREAVASLLGWKIEFMPSGKFRMASIFYSGLNDESEEPENYLLFDGEKGTVQISGGPEGEFAREIRGLLRFWVEERKEIPGLMAACTLEFYERTTRAQRA